MNLLRLFTRTRPITASEAGRRGALAKHERQQARYRETARQLRAELELEPREALR